MVSNLLFIVFFLTSFVATPRADEHLCVANLSTPVNSDGIYSCKDPKFIHANDFSFSRFHFPQTTTHKRKHVFTSAFDNRLPGVNTLGISMMMFNFAAGDFVPPHVHLRGSEIFVVLKGSMLVTLNLPGPISRQLMKVVREGDVFVIPKGLYHSQKNVGKIDATVIAAFNCQHPDGLHHGR